MPYVIAATGGTVLKQSNVVVRIGANKSFSSRTLVVNNNLTEPNSLGEMSGKYDEKFDSVNYYAGGTGNY